MGCWCCACTCESCQNQCLFTGAKEAKFLDFSNGKPVSSWLISISSNISLYKFSFCTSNSWLLFCFDLSTAHLRCATPTSYVISSARSGCEHKLDKSDYYVLNMDIVLRKKTLQFATGGLYSPPRVMWGTFLLWMDVLYWPCFGLMKRNNHPLHYKAWRSQNNFNITDCIVLKKGSHIHLGCLEGK